MPSHPFVARRFFAVVLLIAIVAPALGSGALPAYARSASASVSFTLDGVGLVVQADALPSSEFTVAEPGSADQVATSSAWQPFRELSITAVQLGRKPGSEALPAAAHGGARGYQDALRAFRVQQGADVQDAPAVTLFGKSVTGLQSVVDLFVDGPVQKPVLIDEWVVEAGGELWIVRMSAESSGDPAAQSAQISSGLSVDSKKLADSSSRPLFRKAQLPSSNTGAVAAPAIAASVSGMAASAAGDLPAAAWWSGDCDTNTYSSKSGGIAAYRLGAVYLGMPACGPRPWADGAPDVMVRFFPTAWGSLEWECVELAMRFLYLKYNISPYSANGSQVVWNYPGTRLVKVANGTVGQAPQPNDVLSYGSTSTFGHASVVTASTVDVNGNGTVTVIEQNNTTSGASTLTVTAWRVGGNAGTVSGWLHDNTLNNMNVTVGAGSVGSYALPTGTTSTRSYTSLVDGPVKVVNTQGQPIFTSQVVASGGSYNEIMGMPVNQFTTDYWFPWYDHGYPNVVGDNMRTWILVGNPSTTLTATVNITIGGTLMAGSPFSIAPGSRITPRWIGTVAGPVHVSSNINIFASERVFTVPDNSFNEVMGYPANQFTTEYWFPWYDDVNMSTFIKVGNTSTTQTANVDVYVSGFKKGSYSIPHDQSITDSYAGMVDGPLRVVSTNGVNVVASEWTLSGTTNSFNEIMGYPSNQFTTEYWFPWYDHGYPNVANDNMRTWILVGNPSPISTATVNIYINNVLQSGSPFSIVPGSRVTPRWVGSVNGPVHVVSDIPIFTSERVFTSPSDSFNEMMGYPANKLANEYWFPWYDSVNMPNALLLARP